MANTLKFGNGEWYGKKDTILAYNDENYNYKPLPFKFERDSSATVINKDGLIETVGSGQPRIDYKDDSKGALLLEPSRTNLIPYSQEFTGWSLTNVVETPNALISPDGNLNASKFVTNSLGVDIKYENIPVTANTTYTYSFYCNYVGGEGLQGRFYDNTNGANIEYYSYMNQIEEGVWKRVTRTFTTPSGCSNIQIWYLASSSTQPVTAYYWGAQLEEGSYATSYIPTQGSTVTRLADSCNQTTPDGVIGQTEGTLYWEGKFQDAQNPILMQIVPSSANYLSSIYIEFNKATNSIRFNIYDSGVIQTILTTSATTETKYKIALAYKQNDIQGYVNGVLIGSSTNATIQSGLNNLLIGGLVGYVNNNTFIGTKPNKVKLYNTRLTNAELQALTS